MPTGLEIAAWNGLKTAGSAIWANPVARWAVLIITGLIVHRVWLWFRDRRVRKQIHTKVIEKLEAKEDKLKDKANEAEDAVTRDLNERSLRDVAARSTENLGPVRRPKPD